MSTVGIPALPMMKPLTVVMLPDDGAAKADTALERMADPMWGGAIIVGPTELFFQQLQLRVARDPSLLDKIDVFYLKDGAYQRVGLSKEDELRWPVGFLHEAWAKANEILAVHSSDHGTQT